MRQNRSTFHSEACITAKWRLLKRKLHARFHMTHNRGVKIDHIFGITDPDLPIYYTTCWATMKIKSSLLVSISIVKRSIEKMSPVLSQISTFFLDKIGF